MHARTHTDQYVILIAFPRQQWFRVRASLLRYTYCILPVLFYVLGFGTEALLVKYLRRLYLRQV